MGISGCLDVWVCACIGVSVCRCIGVSVHRCMDGRMDGDANLSQYGTSM